MKEKLAELLEGDGQPSAAVLLAEIEEMDEADIADVFENLDTAKAVRLFRLLPKKIAGEVFSYIVPGRQQAIIETITDKEQAYIINELFADDAADLIEEMPANVARKLLNNATEETRKDINMLLKYPDDSAGSIMTTEYIRLKEQTTVKEVFDIIRRQGVHKETIYTCYVTDSNKKLSGIVSVKDILFADPDAKVGDIMNPSVIRVSTTDTYDKVASMFTKYGFVALPVVDSDDIIMGIVTVDDVLQVIKEEHTDDLSKMAAVKPSDTTYLKTSVVRHSRNRIVWLLLLMVSAMLTGGIISGFENTLTAVPMLIAFIPMLMGAGGNAGSQASTQIIRGMALGEITTRQVLRVWWKEVRVALLCGIGLALVTFLRVIAFEGTTDYYLRIAAVVSLSLCMTIVMAKSLGCLLPMGAKKIRLDPAIMAAPLIATILDALSLLVYFGIAIALLSAYL